MDNRDRREDRAATPPRLEVRRAAPRLRLTTEGASIDVDIIIGCAPCDAARFDARRRELPGASACVVEFLRPGESMGPREGRSGGELEESKRRGGSAVMPALLISDSTCRLYSVTASHCWISDCGRRD